MVETLDEILADKSTAFICQTHVRNRDIWDFNWLKQAQILIGCIYIVSDNDFPEIH